MIFNGLSDVNFGSGVQIATGSYVGTGTYGANNPNTLTFEFEPQIVFIIAHSDYKAAAGDATTIFYSMIIPANSRSFIGSFSELTSSGGVSAGINSGLIQNVSKEGTSVAFYAGSAVNQLNSNGVTYHYVALGAGGGVTEPPTQLTARVIAANVSNPYTILKPRGITYEFVEQVGNQYRYSFTVTPGTLQLASGSTATGRMGVKFEFIDATPSGQFEKAPYTSLQVSIPESNRVNGEYTFTCLMDEKISPFNDSFGFKVTPI